MRNNIFADGLFGCWQNRSRKETKVRSPLFILLFSYGF
jgi:hypothetical protein